MYLRCELDHSLMQTLTGKVGALTTRVLFSLVKTTNFGRVRTLRELMLSKCPAAESQVGGTTGQASAVPAFSSSMWHPSPNLRLSCAMARPKTNTWSRAEHPAACKGNLIPRCTRAAPALHPCCRPVCGASLLHARQPVINHHSLDAEADRDNLAVLN